MTLYVYWCQPCQYATTEAGRLICPHCGEGLAETQHGTPANFNTDTQQPKAA